MKATLSDPITWLYPDTEFPGTPVREFTCDTAQASIADVNILFTELKEGCRLSFSISEETGALGDFRLFQFIDVPVEENTGAVAFTERDGVRNEFVTRRAPFRVYDAMKPISGKTAAAVAKTAAFRLQADIPESSPPGIYTVAIKVCCGKEEASFSFAIRVYGVSLPVDAELKFPYSNWVSFENIAARHGLKLWEGKYWDMLRKYARLAARGRQSSFLIPLRCIFDARDGMPVLNRKRLERIVDIFTDAGMYIIEGGHFGKRTGGEWCAKTFSTAVVEELATSCAGGKVIASIASQLMDVIEENEWQDRWIQHVTDEPIPQNAVDYRIFTGMVRRYMPGIRIMDATQAPDMPGSVDFWCPLITHYEEHIDKFEEMREECGDGVRYYTCCFPGGKFLNRLLDNELIRPLLLGWFGALYDLDGYLHWGLNSYREDQDPFKMSCVPNWGGGTNSLPAGDTHIVYPGAGGPWSSARLEAMRMGMEDKELFSIAAHTGARKASSIISRIISGADNYTTDISAYRKARRELLLAAEASYAKIRREISEL